MRTQRFFGALGIASITLVGACGTATKTRNIRDSGADADARTAVEARPAGDLGADNSNNGDTGLSDGPTADARPVDAPPMGDTILVDRPTTVDAGEADAPGSIQGTRPDANPTDTSSAGDARSADSSILRDTRLADALNATDTWLADAPIMAVDSPILADTILADTARADAFIAVDAWEADAPIAIDTRPVDAYTGGDAHAGSIGVWTDMPGECPAGFTRIDVTSLSDLQDATRGEGSHANDPPDACYLIHDGVYIQQGSTLLFYFQRGGVSSSRPRIFLGQSRTGTVIRGRAAFDNGVSHIVIQNMTFDLNGYSQSGSFSTLELPEVDDILVSHVTFTGDCQTGANGGHIEFLGASNVVVDSCLIENFGRCGPNGHQEHGIYISGGSNLTVRNCEIRGNASRGIQMYTEGGAFGSVDGVLITHNRIHDNGHADYEDGIAFNGSGSGTISNVTVEHNLIYANYYSGIRTVNTAYTNVMVRKNTFYRNGMRSSASGRGEVVLDDSSAGQNQTFTNNILSAGFQVVNNCSSAAARNYQFTDNVVQGTVPSGATCMTGNLAIDPGFENPGEGDFRTSNPEADAYGAYAD